MNPYKNVELTLKSIVEYCDEIPSEKQCYATNCIKGLALRRLEYINKCKLKESEGTK
jgi:hypothetical protein